jgi:hypothetical protein
MSGSAFASSKSITTERTETNGMHGKQLVHGEITEPILTVANARTTLVCGASAT